MPETAETTPAVHAAIVKVADGLRKIGIGKDRKCNVTNGPQFSFRSIDAVYTALSPLLAANNLYICPRSIQVLSNEVAGKLRLTRVLVTYCVTCADDGSSIEVQTLGEGADTSDKGTGKAMSYAYKTLMFQLFCIPLVGQPDTDDEHIEPEVAYIDERLAVRAREAAQAGTENFRGFYRSLSKEDKHALHAAKMIESLQSIAAATDAQEPAL